MEPHRRRIQVLGLAITAALLGCSTTESDGPEGPPGPRARSMTIPLEAAPESTPFSFLFGGHLYGDPGVVSAVPSPTLIAQALAIRTGPDAFLVSGGDLVRAPRPEFLVATREVLRFLDKPVFHVPGNHDHHGEDYESVFGPRFGAFSRGPALFVLVDTEAVPWHFGSDQLAFLARQTEWALARAECEHVVFFSHRVVFAAEDPRYACLLRNCNGRDGFDGSSNYDEDVVPLLRRLVDAGKHVLWFAGDVGVSWSFSAFFDRHPDQGVVYVAAGLGSTPRDILVRVHVDRGAEPRCELVSLANGATVATGEPLDQPIEHYGPEFWSREFALRGDR
ncbi:MAG: metallophosphoesterase [Planctomycetes bacterium]|nr:metallophosphoesterase [Planctomycetota bacterium]